MNRLTYARIEDPCGKRCHRYRDALGCPAGIRPASSSQREITQNAPGGHEQAGGHGGEGEPKQRVTFL
jgi:hypothetical protein